jgi:hypothetical protein
MSTWYQPIPITSGDASTWLNLAKPNSYRILPVEEAPPPLPPDLLSKCEAILVMRSGTPNDEYVVANLYRRDKSALDQMPFGAAFVSGVGISGVLTHHGDWEGRTISGVYQQPSGFQISDRASTAYSQSLAAMALPANNTGSIFDLSPRPNVEAFQDMLAQIKRVVDEGSAGTGS